MQCLDMRVLDDGCARTTMHAMTLVTHQNLANFTLTHSSTPEVGAGPYAAFQAQTESKNHFVSGFSFVSEKKSSVRFCAVANTNIKMVWPNVVRCQRRYPEGWAEFGSTMRQAAKPRSSCFDLAMRGHGRHAA